MSSVCERSSGLGDNGERMSKSVTDHGGFIPGSQPPSSFPSPWGRRVTVGTSNENPGLCGCCSSPGPVATMSGVGCIPLLRPTTGGAEAGDVGVTSGCAAMYSRGSMQCMARVERRRPGLFGQSRQASLHQGVPKAAESTPHRSGPASERGDTHGEGRLREDAAEGGEAPASMSLRSCYFGRRKACYAFNVLFCGCSRG